MKNSKYLVLMMAAVFFVGLFMVTGCGTDEAAPEEPDTDQPADEVAAEEPTEIKVGGKGWAENMTLAYMAAILIEENTVHTVDSSTADMGPTEMLHPAIVGGQIDIYPEYTGTSWMVVLENEDLPNHDEILGKVQEAYAEQFGLTVLDAIGFENTFAIAMTAERAEELGLSTLTDLGQTEGLTFVGDSTSFTRPDVYLGLQEVYGLDMNQVIVDTAFFYEAVAQGEGDVTTCFSTDGRLKEYGFVVLEDDQQFFPPYDATFVVRTEILEMYPSVGEALAPLLGTIDEETMTELNYLVEVQNMEPEDVARDFLTERGLI